MGVGGGEITLWGRMWAIFSALIPLAVSSLSASFLLFPFISASGCARKLASRICERKTTAVKTTAVTLPTSQTS